MTSAFQIRHDSGKIRPCQLAFFDMGRHRCVVKLLTMFAPITKTGVLFDIDRLFNNFHLLNNTAGVFDRCKNTTTVRTGIKGMSLKIIDFFRTKKWPFMLGMSWLSTDFARFIASCISRWLDNIRGWGLGGVGRVLREFSNLVSEFSHLFHKLSDLLFKFRNAFIASFQLSFKFGDASDIELFFFRGQFSSSSHLLWLLSGERGPPLEKRQIFSAPITSLKVLL